jgi:[ribosomal protein S5]-alanine N-acetyltransferase
MHTFETERLLMRPLEPEDQAFYCACYTDPVLMRHIGEPLTQEAALRSFAAASKPRVQHTLWVMQEKKTIANVGLLALIYRRNQYGSFNAELGNIMLSEFQNKGLTIEALNALFGMAFKADNLDTIIVNHKSNNGAVTRIVKKLGFIQSTTDSTDMPSGGWIMPRNHWHGLRAVTNPL